MRVQGPCRWGGRGLTAAAALLHCTALCPSVSARSPAAAAAAAGVASPISLLEQTTDESLRVPDAPDLSCKSLKPTGSGAYRSSACTNADWDTYGWIYTQAATTRVRTRTAGRACMCNANNWTSEGQRVSARWPLHRRSSGLTAFIRARCQCDSSASICRVR